MAIEWVAWIFWGQSGFSIERDRDSSSMLTTVVKWNFQNELHGYDQCYRVAALHRILTEFHSMCLNSVLFHLGCHWRLQSKGKFISLYVLLLFDFLYLRELLRHSSWCFLSIYMCILYFTQFWIATRVSATRAILICRCHMLINMQMHCNIGGATFEMKFIRITINLILCVMF